MHKTIWSRQRGLWAILWIVPSASWNVKSSTLGTIKLLMASWNVVWRIRSAGLFLETFSLHYNKVRGKPRLRKEKIWASAWPVRRITSYDLLGNRTKLIIYHIMSISNSTHHSAWQLCILWSFSRVIWLKYHTSHFISTITSLSRYYHLSRIPSDQILAKTKGSFEWEDFTLRTTYLGSLKILVRWSSSTVKPPGGPKAPPSLAPPRFCRSRRGQGG